MTPADNVLYFNHDIDVRLCLKNGFTSLRYLWANIEKEYLLTHWRDSVKFIDKRTGKLYHEAAGTIVRYELAMKYQDIWDIPFRRNSYRVAVKRDPVERFLSTINYLERVKIYDGSDKNKRYISLEDIDKNDIDKVLDAFENQTLRDEHFFSQTYFLGHPNDYDKVYSLSELDQLIQWLCRKCDYPYMDIRLNQNTDTTPTLTDAQQMRIIKMYAKDYANGWY